MMEVISAKALMLSSGKRQVVIDPPWMNAAGMLGFSDEASRWINLGRLGAIITHPISLHRRLPSRGKRVMPFPGGIAVHSGLPNPGLNAVISSHQSRWAALPCPCIAHLIATDPAEIELMTHRLESVEPIAALELGLQASEPLEVEALVSAAAGEFPIIARLPGGGGPALAEAALSAGATALSIGPARGIMAGLQTGAAPTEGRLYGPALLPLALRQLAGLRRLTDRPLIAAGGIFNLQHIRSAFDLGADAVQFDSVLWVDPDAVLVDDGLQAITGENQGAAPA
jgi:dihydroorotate dehydrogenase (NAD+) catalytic subunit